MEIEEFVLGGIIFLLVDDELKGAVCDGAGAEVVERAEQFVVPEDVATGRVFFADEEFGEAEGFRGLGVVARGDRDAGLAGEVAEDGFGVDRIVRAIDGEARRAAAMPEPGERERGEGVEWEMAAGHETTIILSGVSGGRRRAETESKDL